MATHLDIRPFKPRDRSAVLRRLSRHTRENLLLIDAVRRIDDLPADGEIRPEILIVEEGHEIVGVALLQPIISLDNEADSRVVSALIPYVTDVDSGIIKTRKDVADIWWQSMPPRGRRVVLDRVELVYAVTSDQSRLADLPEGLSEGWALDRDLAELIEATRQSLREEDRLDPFEGNPKGFRRWVAARLQRALVLTCSHELCFVGYADIRCPEGWLLQGVFTPDAYRRRGFAAAGVSALCRQAFASGADHVQLAVVNGNTAANHLYRQLGFECFGLFRTILFS